MSNRLRDEVKRQEASKTDAPRGRPDRDRPPERRPPLNWRLWLTGAALMFGAYVYLGPIVLKDDYQWRVLTGIASGKGEAAAITQTIQAEAAKAAAITAAQKGIEVPAAIQIAEGAERAKVAPAVETAASTARITVQQKAEEARINVWTSSEQAKIEVAKNTLTDIARAYQACVDRAQQAGESAGRSAATSQYGTLALQEVARDRAYDLAMATCEQYKPARDDAISRAQQSGDNAVQNLQQTPRVGR